ncbi:MAG: hypothetical protein M1366_06150 [Patescibacteria group bacterium]|nr:hypothetical protein [Patescibacteria group bacterium]
MNDRVSEVDKMAERMGTDFKSRATVALTRAVYTFVGWLDTDPFFSPQLTRDRDSKGRATAFDDMDQARLDSAQARQRDRLPKQTAIFNAVTAMRDGAPPRTVLELMGGHRRLRTPAPAA